MSRIATIILLAVVIAFSYFAFYNQGGMTLNFWKGKVVELPVAGVVLLSMALGAALILLMFTIRGIGRTYDQIQLGFKIRRRIKAEELYNRGVDSHLSGKMQQAVNLLEEAVSKDPEFLLPFFRLGTVYLALGEVEKALQLHQQALEAHPGNLRVLLLLVDDYMATGQLNEAAGVLRQIISKDDTNRTALKTLRDIQERQGEWEGATETQRKLMKAAGRDGDSLQHLRGLRYQWALQMMEKGDNDKAVKTFKEILKESPDFIAATVSLGEVNLKTGKVEEGIRTLIEGYRRHQNPVFLQVMEDRLISRENPRKLIETFRELLGSSPDDVFLSLFYGKICLRLEMIDEAYEALKKVESTGYDSALLHALLGETSARRERFGEAIGEFQRYLEMTDGSSPRFVCENCENKSEGWSPRCESCGLWNSYSLPGLTEPFLRPAVRPLYEFEE
ncbi:MAG: DUF1049 domain-containing protein [bacterium]|nr:MAG: DUF1049 domain-containing protein [bacterium]